ncbi:ribosome biogenesis protein ytm1 [Lignoscripta atroalba]|nr:ribosome biogenesis protein ytm1 [Lignoscripta atroalba]
MASSSPNVAATSGELDSSLSQVRLQLTTRQADISLPANTGPIFVNTSGRNIDNLRRYALSTLVNTLLQTEKPIPLEFLINGTFLRTSIDEYLTANGISSETTLTVEYIRAIIPPLYLASFEHDDWVSSVDILSSTSSAGPWAGNTASSPAPGHERILSGSYDGLLRVWNMSSEVLVTSPGVSDGGHSSSIKAAKFLSPTQIVSSGLDRTIRVWKYNEDAEGFTASLTPQIELYGHKASIDSTAVHNPSSRILSASADHSVGIWSSKKSDAPTAPASLLPQNNTRSSKRRKLSTSTSTPQRGPLALMKSHSAPVSSVIFAPNDPTVAHSASWDHTLRTWDLPTASLVDTRTTSHALLSLTALPDLNLLAVGTSARHVTLIDPRASATTISAMTLRGHTNAVVALARDPGSSYGLLSGSHDGTCRIWDVRSSRSEKEGLVGKSMYTIPRESAKDEGRRAGGEGIKVFGVCWDREVGIVSAGEDKKVQINRGKGVVGKGGGG